MKVKINGKVFIADSPVNNRIKIKQDFDEFDILFFKKWMKDPIEKNLNKKDYIKDIDFVSKINSGTFIGCFPVELDEDYVILVYDGLEII